MPTITVQTAQGLKEVTIDDAASPEQIEEVADEVAAQFSRPSLSRAQQVAVGQEAALPAAAETGRAAASGIAEGVRRLGGGAKQFAGWLSDIYTGLAEDTGPINVRTKEAKATAAELLRRANADFEAKEAGINMDARGVAAGATELAALGLGGEAALPRATTLLGGIAKNFAAGGIGELLNFKTSDTFAKPGDAAAAGTVSAMLGVAPSVVPATLNGMARRYLAASADRRGETARLAAEAAMPGTVFTVGQSGIPQLQALEKASYNSDLINFYADQSANYVERFAATFDQQLPAGLSAAGAFTATRTRAETALKNLRRNASAAWDAGMAEAQRIADTLVTTPQGAAAAQAGPDAGIRFRDDFGPQLEGGPRRLPPPQQNPRAPPLDTDPENTGRIPIFNLREQLRREIADATDPLANLGGEGALSAGAIAALRGVQQGGSLSIQQYSSLLKGLTRLSRHEDPVRRAAAGKLRDALEADIDVLAREGGPTTNAAVRQVLETRAAYRQMMLQAEAMGNHAAFRMLGYNPQTRRFDDLGDITNQEAYTRFQKLAPERQEAFREFARQNAPELLVAFRQQAVDDVVRRSINPNRAAVDSREDLSLMLDALVHPPGHELAGRLRSPGLWNAEERRRLEGVVDGIRTINNFRPELLRGGTAILPADVAPNIVSMNGIFIARQFARYLTGERGGEFLTDPRLLEGLRIINRSTTGSTVNMAARASLLSWLGTDAEQQYLGEERKALEQPNVGQ